MDSGPNIQKEPSVVKVFSMWFWQVTFPHFVREREGGGGGNYVFLTYSVIPLNEVVSISIHQIAVIVNYYPWEIICFK